MNEVGRELDKVRHGWRRTRGRRLVDRLHIALLVVAVLLAFGHRLFGPWPPFGDLAADGIVFYAIRVLAIALALLLLGPLLRGVASRLVRVEPRRLARQLDDRLDWHDSIDTAIGLPGAPMRPPIQTFLAAQSVGRLRAVDPRRLWPAGPRLKWTRRILAFLFVAVLLLPGVAGRRGGRGAGQGEVGLAGTRPHRPVSEPLPIDEWLATHVRDPLPAEPLFSSKSPPAPDDLGESKDSLGPGGSR